MTFSSMSYVFPCTCLQVTHEMSFMSGWAYKAQDKGQLYSRIVIESTR